MCVFDNDQYYFFHLYVKIVLFILYLFIIDIPFQEASTRIKVNSGEIFSPMKLNDPCMMLFI